MLHRPNHYRLKYSYGKTGMGNKHNGHSSTIQKSNTTFTACTTMETTEPMEMDTRQNKSTIMARGRTKNSKSSAVHFNPNVVVHCNNDGAFSDAETASYWLSSTDFSSIRNKMMMTLNIMKLTSHPTSSTASSASSSLLLPASYCSRGIEQYALDNTGCLDTSVVVRRQNALRVVLNEQAFQRQQQQQQQPHQEDDVDIHINTIRDLYAQETYLNMHYGIYAGNIDSQEALKVYVGQQQEQPPQNQQRLVLTPTPNKNGKNKFVSLPASSSLSSFPLPRLFPSKSEPEHVGMISKAA